MIKNIYLENIKKNIEDISSNMTFATLADHLVELHMTIIACLSEIDDVDLSIFNDKGLKMFEQYHSVCVGMNRIDITAKAMSNVAVWLYGSYCKLPEIEKTNVDREFIEMSLNKDFFRGFIYDFNH